MRRYEARQRNSLRGRRPYVTAPYAKSAVPATHSGLGWLASALAIIVVLSVSDVVGGDKAAFSGALALTPFLASVGARPRAVFLVGVAALAAPIVLAFFDGFLPSNGVAHVSALIVVSTGVAVEAAVLRQRRERRLARLADVAETAQRAIIRRLPPVVGSVAVSTWYESPGDVATVGGDCYEVLDTAHGTRLIIGDVRGHGLPSVGLAALVLGAFRALAHTEADLVNIARELDALVVRYASDKESRDVDGEEFVTAVLAEVRGSKLRLVNSGHPPPLLISSAGEVRSLKTDTAAPPLGWGSRPELASFDLGPHARVLLYTDGVLESTDPSGRPFDLVSAVGTLCSGPLDEAVQAVVAELDEHTHGLVNDDVTLMAFEHLAVPEADAEPANCFATGYRAA
jgi:serine phosphatase RsbU (regulator of sigma subunit)